MERDRKFLKEEKWSSGGGRGGDISRSQRGTDNGDRSTI